MLCSAFQLARHPKSAVRISTESLYFTVCIKMRLIDGVKKLISVINALKKLAV